MKKLLRFYWLAVYSLSLYAADPLSPLPDTSRAVQQVKVLLTDPNHLSQVGEKLVPQLKTIYAATTNTSEKLALLNYLAENPSLRPGDTVENRYAVLEYAANEYGLLQSSNQASKWAAEVLGRFVKSESNDFYKATALKKLLVLQVLGGEPSAATNTLSELIRLARSSADLQLAKQRGIILTEAFGGYSEGMANPKEQSAWLKDNLLRLSQDPANTPQDKWAFTMGLGYAYSDVGSAEDAKAARVHFTQAMEGTTDVEQKLEGLQWIAYSCVQI